MKDLPDDLRADPDAADRDFPPSRAAALERMAAFAPLAGRDYGAKRNHDLPGHPHVSALSPWLRHRAITEAELCDAVLACVPADEAETFIREILWRTYWKGWLERRPGIWDAYRAGVERGRNRLATESGLRGRWEDACEGRTGIAPFDAWAAELGRTGYLHNHARMWFASIWIHTLELPWELGADLFLRHLLDGDPASNTLSWRWVAGLQTRSKSYRARASNIAKYTGGRFDPQALGHQLATEAPEPDAPEHPEPGPVPEDADWDREARVGLLLHEDDLSPDFLWARGLDPVAATVLIAPEGRSPLAVSDRVVRFTRALAQDACDRLPGPCGGGCRPTDDVEAVAAWVRAAGIEQLVAPWAPVGPLRDKLDRLETALDIPLRRPLRAWDAAAWPRATHGFRRFAAGTAEILESRGRDLHRAPPDEG